MEKIKWVDLTRIRLVGVQWTLNIDSLDGKKKIHLREELQIFTAILSLL